jgi:ubiquinone/menaquinone biosynthesis C-methylase UbiE
MSVETSWSADEVCAGFEAYRDLPEQLLGYRKVFELLAPTPSSTVLDYGCGPGKVALRLAERFGSRVIGVDSSPTMLELARARRSHPRVRYEQIADERLADLADASVDGAMACYVFINVPSERTLQRISDEVFRVLRPDRPFVVLDTNPDTTGVEFSTFVSGAPGRRYERGEQREVRLRVPVGRDLLLLDYHWPKETYREVFRRSGFRAVEEHEPTLRQLDAEEVRAFSDEHGVVWRGEWEQPPFVVFCAAK